MMLGENPFCIIPLLDKRLAVVSGGPSHLSCDALPLNAEQIGRSNKSMYAGPFDVVVVIANQHVKCGSASFRQGSRSRLLPNTKVRQANGLIGLPHNSNEHYPLKPFLTVKDDYAQNRVHGDFAQTMEKTDCQEGRPAISFKLWSLTLPHLGHVTLPLCSAISDRNAEKAWPQCLQVRSAF